MVAVAAQLPAQEQRRRVGLPGVFVFWHFLSLDAPTVAVVWALSFARALGLDLSPAAIGVLGVGTWMIYVTDRLLDARWGVDSELRERHFFHADHRRAFGAGLVVAGLVLAWLIAVMPWQARRADSILFAASMLYFAAAHFPAVRFRRRSARQVAVGVLFACATAVPAWSQAPIRGALLVPAILFAALCCLNCVAIEAWERQEGPRRGFSPRALAIGVALMSIASCFLPLMRAPGEIRLAAAVLSSSLFLLVLDELKRRFTERRTGPAAASHFLLALRIAADVALLTPALLVIPWRP